MTTLELVQYVLGAETTPPPADGWWNVSWFAGYIVAASVTAIGLGTALGAIFTRFTQPQPRTRTKEQPLSSKVNYTVDNGFPKLTISVAACGISNRPVLQAKDDADKVWKLVQFREDGSLERVGGVNCPAIPTDSEGRVKIV